MNVELHEIMAVLCAA